MFSVSTKSGIHIYNLTNSFYSSYLIEKNNIFCMIDTARKGSFKKILKSLNKIKPGLSKIDYLLLTHTHFDHCENAHRIKKQFHSKIIVGKSEAESLIKGYQTLPRGTKRIYTILSKAGHKLIKSYFQYEGIEPDLIIDDEYHLHDFGKNTTIFPTPGHTSGSISLIIDDEIALTGDTMFGVPKNNIYPPFADYPDMIIENWKFFLNTNCQLFLSGHGKPITREKLKENYLKIINSVQKTP
ncbi:MAG: MBL fold metallo-hydrolase [Marinilabiliales bacterium]